MESLQHVRALDLRLQVRRRGGDWASRFPPTPHWQVGEERAQLPEGEGVAQPCPGT